MPYHDTFTIKLKLIYCCIHYYQIGINIRYEYIPGMHN